ncbi:ATP-dependent endonuclease [Actinomadura syzygii]|uniref:ATP-dependent nuclease n=1 Tax=Actinomadura syzygii TaxID=1427538 RepID=UPI001CA340E2|nr:AAA family ATPase [Actinomadura syzygii]
MAIRNYRCLRDVDIRFDDITTFIGPNGVGKSAVLRALEWFFNGPPGGRGLTEDDVWAGAERKQISVGVEFSDLTDTDRNALGKYAAGDVQTVWLWRRWEDGSDKLSGRALTYPPFDEIRAIKGAVDRRKRYRTLTDEDPGLDLPPVKNAQELDDAMTRWEREHPELLEGTELDSDTHFFGFAGQAKMTGLFDYVFVSADLRAGEEGRDVKGSVIGRILNQAIDRSEAEEEMAELQILVNANRESIQSKHFGKQLESLSDQLTTEIEQLTMGRRVQVDSLVPELLLPQAQFQVSIQDGTARTRIDQQGHGFQRALLVTALRVLAQSAVTASDRTILLAIEEPELFQHPVQARAFAAILRKLAADTGHGVQIAYGTHSPYFLETEGFAQIRRMTREFAQGAPSVRIHSTTADDVAARLSTVLGRDQIDRRLTNMYLLNLPEALFGHAVLLVEGSTDKGVWEGCGQRLDPLKRHSVVVANVGGKDNIALAHAVLTELGVPCYAVFDGDANCKADKVEENKRKNRLLVGYLGGVPEDFPVTKVHDPYAVAHEDLETYLRSEWPDWEDARRSLITDGRGVDGKNWATYRQAAVEAILDPPAWLSDVISKVRDLCPDG